MPLLAGTVVLEALFAGALLASDLITGPLVEGPLGGDSPPPWSSTPASSLPDGSTTWVAFRRSLLPQSRKPLYRHDTNTHEDVK